jgi:hypothetical protein
MRRQSRAKTRSCAGWMLMTLLLVACGCHNTATVTGNVRYRGRAVTYGSVIFLNADKTARSGVIAPDGSYAVENVPPGNVRIGVISHDPAKGRSIVRGQKPGLPGQQGTSTQEPAVKTWFPLPANYENPERSGLVCTVSAGQINHDIDLP